MWGPSVMERCGRKSQSVVAMVCACWSCLACSTQGYPQWFKIQLENEDVWINLWNVYDSTSDYEEEEKQHNHYIQSEASSGN